MPAIKGLDWRTEFAKVTQPYYVPSYPMAIPNISLLSYVFSLYSLLFLSFFLLGQAKPAKTMPYITDLCLLEILDSPACC
jgi:hypothetical protein